MAKDRVQARYCDVEILYVLPLPAIFGSGLIYEAAVNALLLEMNVLRAARGGILAEVPQHPEAMTIDLLRSKLTGLPTSGVAVLDPVTLDVAGATGASILDGDLRRVAMGGLQFAMLKGSPETYTVEKRGITHVLLDPDGSHVTVDDFQSLAGKVIVFDNGTVLPLNIPSVLFSVFRNTLAIPQIEVLAPHICLLRNIAFEHRDRLGASQDAHLTMHQFLKHGNLDRLPKHLTAFETMREHQRVFERTLGLPRRAESAA
jgi:hypothetical protein